MMWLNLPLDPARRAVKNKEIYKFSSVSSTKATVGHVVLPLAARCLRNFLQSSERLSKGKQTCIISQSMQAQRAMNDQNPKASSFFAFSLVGNVCLLSPILL